MKKTIILCVASLLVSIGSICISSFRCEPITADWMGILVGVLSFLVTLLLGWQIYTLIDIRKIQAEIREKESDIYVRSEMNQAETHMALWVFYQTNMTEGDIVENSQYGFVQSGISAIVHFSKCGNYAKASSIAMTLTRYLPKLTIQEHSDKFFDTSLKSLLSGVEQPNKVQGFQELLVALCKARG